MEKLIVNDNCIGCGMCVAIDEEHFAIVDGLSQAQSNENLDSETLQNAMDSCPTAAIEIINEGDESANEVVAESENETVNEEEAIEEN